MRATRAGNGAPRTTPEPRRQRTTPTEVDCTKVTAKGLKLNSSRVSGRSERRSGLEPNGISISRGNCSAFGGHAAGGARRVKYSPELTIPYYWCVVELGRAVNPRN